MKTMKTNDLIKLLKSNGYNEDRQNGSHLTMKNAQTGKTVTVVNSREQAPGTLRNILKLAGLK